MRFEFDTAKKWAEFLLVCGSIIRAQSTSAKGGDGPIYQKRYETGARKSGLRNVRDFTLPEGTILPGDMPDIVIDGPRKIGIEITDLYHADGGDPSSEQVQQRYRSAVVEQAQALHREAGGRSIEVHFAFNFDKPIGKVEPLAKVIADFARSIE